MKRLLRTAALNALLGVAFTAGLMASANSAYAARAYLGGYTPEAPGARSNNRGEGIYLVDVDNATGAPGNLKLVAKTLSPSWLTMSKDGKFLYAVNEVASFGPDKSGSVTAYAVNAQTGALKQLNVVSSQGAIPCYVSVHPSGKFLLVANYTGGTFSVIPIKADGSLGEATDVIKPGGPTNSANAVDAPKGQSPSQPNRITRGHMIHADPSGQYVVGDDAGRDQIFVWKLDTNSGKLNQVSVTRTLAGSAPRHFVFSPDGKTLYQIGEYNMRLTVYGFADGKLTPKGAGISALPDGYEGSGTASELLISKDGKRIYSANRTHDSIATFAVDASGGVKRIGLTHTEGDTPRSLTIDPSGKFLYSMNQSANNLATFRFDANGVPKFTGKFLAVGTPATMVFLP
jgi:6-phosphogluconolactonase (cycloisomerase 2 family)